MKSLNEIRQILNSKEVRLIDGTGGGDKDDGLAVTLDTGAGIYRIVASWGMGWEHVSVSLVNADRCPSWEEMCCIKNMFWRKNECVIQYHPPEDRYVNNHPFCLHLWKPKRHSLPMPPVEFVGIRN